MVLNWGFIIHERVTSYIKVLLLLHGIFHFAIFNIELWRERLTRINWFIASRSCYFTLCTLLKIDEPRSDGIWYTVPFMVNCTVSLGIKELIYRRWCILGEGNRRGLGVEQRGYSPAKSLFLHWTVSPSKFNKILIFFRSTTFGCSYRVPPSPTTS